MAGIRCKSISQALGGGFEAVEDQHKELEKEKSLIFRLQRVHKQESKKGDTGDKNMRSEDLDKENNESSLPIERNS